MIREDEMNKDRALISRDTITINISQSEVLSEIIPTLLRKQDEVSAKLATIFLEAVEERHLSLRACADKYLELTEEDIRWYDAKAKETAQLRDEVQRLEERNKEYLEKDSVDIQLLKKEVEEKDIVINNLRERLENG